MPLYAMMTEPGVAEQFLFTTLIEDAIIQNLVVDRVFTSLAPQGAAYPLIVIGNLAGTDVQGFGPLRTMSRQVYQIKAITNQASIVVLDEIQARVDVLLTDIQAVLPGGFMLGTRRLSTAIIGVPEAGITYRQFITTWELFIRAQAT